MDLGIQQNGAATELRSSPQLEAREPKLFALLEEHPDAAIYLSLPGRAVFVPALVIKPPVTASGPRTLRWPGPQEEAHVSRNETA
ncbi:MAG: hypothetical protein F4150_04710 [Chloroflexi bacterium]|nr:hypothetical protein [Chloroflexota bacterium]